MLIKLLTSIEDVEQLRQDWLRLHEKTGGRVFSHPAWVSHFYRCYPPTSIVVCAAYDDRNTLVALLPLAIRELSIAGIRYTALQHGSHDSADYAECLIDPAVNPRIVINRMLKSLTELDAPQWELIHFDNISDADPTGKLLLAITARRFYSIRIAGIATPSIDFEAGFSENRKTGNIRRNMQRAPQQPRLEIQRGEEIRPADLDRLIDMHRAALPEAEFHRDRAQSFYRALLADPDFTGHCELALLRLGDNIVAGHFGFVDRGQYYYYVPAFDPEAGEFGPGQYLLWQLIEQASARSLPKFDLLRGDEPYKFDWANRVDRNHCLLGSRRKPGFGRRLMLNLWAARRSLPLFGGPGNNC